MTWHFEWQQAVHRYIRDILDREVQSRWTAWCLLWAFVGLQPCSDCGRTDGHSADCFYHGPY